MAAKIIQLERYRQDTRFKKWGVIFPQLYRATGFYWDVAGDDLVPSDSPAAPFYTLSHEPGNSLSKMKMEPIHWLTPDVDSGWLFVRHHRSLEALDGYMDAVGDHHNDWNKYEQVVFKTPEGIFTLLHRAATPGCPDNLVVYATRPNGSVDAGQINVVLPGGEIVEDSILTPPEGLENET